jgi:hypothetical protein
MAKGNDWIEFKRLEGWKEPEDHQDSNSYMMNSLALAVWWGFDSVLKDIVESGADINLPGTLCGNALQTAVRHGRFTTVKALTDLGADINYIPEDGEAPLESAIICGWQEIIDYFLQLGADVNQLNNGRTIWGGPLGAAALGNDVPNMMRLIAMGANIHRGIEGVGSTLQRAPPGTVLDTAVFGGCVEATLLLLASGASPYRESIVHLACRLFLPVKGPEDKILKKAEKLVQGFAALGHHIEIHQKWQLPLRQRRQWPVMFRAKRTAAPLSHREMAGSSERLVSRSEVGTVVEDDDRVGPPADVTGTRLAEVNSSGVGSDKMPQTFQSESRGKVERWHPGSGKLQPKEMESFLRWLGAGTPWVMDESGMLRWDPQHVGRPTYGPRDRRWDSFMEEGSLFFGV